MKKLLKILMMIILIMLTSCEDVIELELEESEPRLVVEANLIWSRDEPENPHFIRLTTTAPYFSDVVPPAEGAEVSLFGPGGQEYFFRETEPGIFRHDGFEPQESGTYELVILYEDDEYRATEQFVEAPQLETIEQIDNGGFAGDEIELRAYYVDPVDQENYYLFLFFHEGLSLQLANDNFTNGNRSFARFSDEDLTPGDWISIQIRGISQNFYEYMYLLLSQSGNRSGPFQTQPTTVRGNVVNITTPDNFAFGYFSLSASHLLQYEVQ